MLDYYLRLNDPLAPVYEVDTKANTYRMVASRIGVVDGVGGSMPDGGAEFRTDRFAQVWPAGEEDGVTRFTREQPQQSA